MLASTIDPEFGSPLCNELKGPLSCEAMDSGEDIWTDINLAMLYEHLNAGANEQTHPWDPILRKTDTGRNGGDGEETLGTHRPKALLSNRPIKVGRNEEKECIAQLLLRPVVTENVSLAKSGKTDKDNKVMRYYSANAKESIFSDHGQKF